MFHFPFYGSVHLSIHVSVRIGSGISFGTSPPRATNDGWPGYLLFFIDVCFFLSKIISVSGYVSSSVEESLPICDIELGTDEMIMSVPSLKFGCGPLMGCDIRRGSTLLCLLGLIISDGVDVARHPNPLMDRIPVMKKLGGMGFGIDVSTPRQALASGDDKERNHSVMGEPLVVRVDVEPSFLFTMSLLESLLRRNAELNKR